MGSRSEAIESVTEVGECITVPKLAERLRDTWPGVPFDTIKSRVSHTLYQGRKYGTWAKHCVGPEVIWERLK